MAKRKLPEHIECPRATRFPSDQLEGMGSTAKFPNRMITNNGEKIGTSQMPTPAQEPPDFIYDMHSGPGKRGRK